MEKEFKGIIKNLSNSDYHSEKKHLSSTNVKMILKDLEKFYDEKVLGNSPPYKQNNAFDEGSLAHCMILEPEILNDEFAFYPGLRKQGSEYREFKEANKEKIVISKPQLKRVENWVKAYKNNKTACELIGPCEAELSLFGTLYDVPIKVRADGINVDNGYVIDVKTTSYDTDVDSFKITCDQFGYQLSGALYSKMFEIYYKKKFDFYFVVLGKKDFSCEVFKLSDESKNKGMADINRALKIYKNCLETGKWKSNIIKKLEIKTYNDYKILEI